MEVSEDEFAKVRRQNLERISRFSSDVDDAPAADDLKAMAARMRRDAPWKSEAEIAALVAAVVREKNQPNANVSIKMACRFRKI